MAGAGCSDCALSLQAEAQEKDPSERTPEEQALAEANEAELDDVMQEQVPSVFGVPAYGPLSNYGGEFCVFCFTMGLLASVVLGGITGYIAVVASIVGDSTGGLILGTVVTVGLGLHVAYFGRFLLFGAVLGPPVEWLFAQFGLYLTTKARNTYKSDTVSQPRDTTGDLPPKPEIVTDGGPQAEGSPDVSPIPGQDDPEKERLRQKLQQFDERQEILEEQLEDRNTELYELQQQVEEIKEDKQEIRNQLQQKDQEIQEREQRIDQLEGRLGLAARSVGDTGTENTVQVLVPHPNKDAGAATFHAVTTIRYNSPEFRHPQPALVGSWNISDIIDGKIPDPSEIPENPDEDWIERHEDLFPVHPDDYKEPIDFIDRSHAKYDRDEDNALLLNSWADADDVNEQALEDLDADFDFAVLRLGVDLDGNIVRDSGDDSGELRHLRSRNTELQRQVRKARSIADRREDKIQELQNELQIARQENQDLRRDLEQARDDSQELRQTVSQLQQQNEIVSGRAELAEKNAERHRRDAEAAHETRRTLESKNLRGGQDRDLERTREESRRIGRKTAVEAIRQTIEFVWDKYDWDQVVEDPSHDVDPQEAVQEFLNLDRDTLNPNQKEAQSKVKDRITGDLTNGQV